GRCPTCSTRHAATSGIGTEGRVTTMEFGMFHEFMRVPGQTEEEAFADSFEQVDAAERYGLDVMWLAELHTAPERSVLAAPLMLATAIAPPANRVKIGTP